MAKKVVTMQICEVVLAKLDKKVSKLKKTDPKISKQAYVQKVLEKDLDS